MERADVVIVGGGASGLMAAIAAAEAGASVVLLEAGARLGRKIAASGNGRCNFTHRGLDPAHYHSHTPYALSPALAQFSDEDAVAFFTDLGLPPYIDDRDRVYPYARKAGMVTDALRLWAAHRGVVLRTDHRVTGISGGYGAFQVDSPAGPVEGRTVIVACGGQAAPQLGGSTDGYALLEALGHVSRPRHPAICPICTEKAAIRGLQGLRWWVDARFKASQDRPDASGEVLFNADGLSGPVAFDLAHAVGERLEGQNIRLYLDLFPDLPAERLEAHLALRMDRLGWQPVAAFTAGLLPKPLGLVLMRRLYAGKMTDGAAALPADMPQAFTALAKNYPLAVTGLRPYQDAQVTAGGIDLADFDPETLMSWLVPGLFACGEVLDVTGDCGGYNLQWAWASGRLAGRSAAAFAG